MRVGRIAGLAVPCLFLFPAALLFLFLTWPLFLGLLSLSAIGVGSDPLGKVWFIGGARSLNGLQVLIEKHLGLGSLWHGVAVPVLRVPYLWSWGLWLVLLLGLGVGGFLWFRRFSS